MSRRSMVRTEPSLQGRLAAAVARSPGTFSAMAMTARRRCGRTGNVTFRSLSIRHKLSAGAAAGAGKDDPSTRPAPPSSSRQLATAPS